MHGYMGIMEQEMETCTLFRSRIISVLTEEAPVSPIKLSNPAPNISDLDVNSLNRNPVVINPRV